MNYQLYRTERNIEPNAAMTVGAEPKCSFLFDPANPDYAAYLAWVEAGNTPEPAPIPEPQVELTPAEKLAASGLTMEELKGLLGLT